MNGGAQDRGREQRPRGGVPPLLRGQAAGLCPRCRHGRTVASERGSRFLLCGLARSDSRYRKYPPQPVVACPGFEG